MPSFRQKIAGLIRQLSAPSDTRPEADVSVASSAFIQQYLNRKEAHRDEPKILHGRSYQELPSQKVGQLSYPVITAMTGPGGGLTTVNQQQRCLSTSDPDVHFIDVVDDEISCRNVDETDRQLRDANSNLSTLLPPLSSKSSLEFHPLQKSDSAPDAYSKINFEINKNSELKKEIAGVSEWSSGNSRAYGASMTLYEMHPLTRVHAGEPIADCFAIVSRKNSAIIVLADGVNWGHKASLAARAAVHGCVDYLNKAIFSKPTQGVTTTTDVFIALLRSFHAAHTLILQEQGMLTTLTAAVVLPSAVPDKYIVCTCNVGDSLAYVYSPKYGVREITQGSHDVHSMRDMRDALGALGPVDGQNPELSNLTLSMTDVFPGDVVFLTSDGVSDNLDPVVGKFAGLPSIEAHQRHRLTLLRTEDLLKHGVSGKGPSCTSAKELVKLLLDFVTHLTAAKRRILEDVELYSGAEGKALSRSEQRCKRKEICGKLALVPGKLDHATCVAYTVGDVQPFS
ncbi:unnamed protein product [Bemisia tabaci]|uniref:PPM-type phosphatase domain-containing protein n=1 Tax=Bemisia tabaci TaxID=7038 RepID=A0A9P0AG64_BEMTA|nr:PREDICTED: PP2C-like domain-containing protein CG9801 [Bemisia tabaci]CAH0391098.1 unnamed protein product [Bemisia tabaci]